MKLMNKIYNNKEFMDVTSPILSNTEFMKTKSIVHHGTTRYNHSVRVAYLSYKCSKALGCDTIATARAGALHDFFLERNDKNIATETKMLIKHPTIAKENAINYFGVNEKEQNIIEAHMFPISSVSPKSKEAWIVTFCDKAVAILEGMRSVRTQVSIWTLLLINFIK